MFRKTMKKLLFIIATISATINIIHAQDLPKWTLKRHSSELILNSFNNGDTVCPVVKVDTCLYFVGEKQFYYSPKIIASFSGGQDSLTVFISKHLEFVDYQNICPKVLIAFLVSQTGDIEYAGIYRVADERYNKAALDLMQKMPKWQPAVLDDYPVCSFNVLAIDFIHR